MYLGVVGSESDLKSLRLVNLTEVDNLQGVPPTEGEGETKKTEQSTRDWLNKHKRWTLSCEGSGGAAPGDTLNKALQTLFGEYYFLYFRRCENMMFMD